MDDWRELVKQRRFADAEPLMLAATDPENDKYGDDTVARAEFYEAWGDATRDPIEATDRYNQSDFYFSMYASWSTSGGEGTARMQDVNRVKNKVKNVRREL
ncbi:MAG TPA: hypothetical protein VGJ02_11575 [Pyrinomonadaceae bacterium]|jgi:hypothetical protein